MLDTEIFPKLYAVLDTAFPEFGFQSKESYWVATTGACPECGGKAHHMYCYEDKPFCIKCHHCSKAVSWYTYLREKENLNNKETFIKLAEFAGISLSASYSVDYDSLEATQKKTQIFEDIMVWSQGLLPESTVLQDYLINKRGYSADEIKEMELGYLPSQGEVKKYLSGKGYTAEEIKESGIHTLGDNHNLVIGYRDGVGRLAGIVGRTISEARDDIPKYISNIGLNKSTPFNLHIARKSEDIIVVEGYFDVLALRVRGVENVVAISGNTLTKNQVESLAKYGIQYITFIPDNDEEGRNGLERSIINIETSEIKSFVAELPQEYGDPDDFVKAKGIDAFKEALKTAVKSVKWKASRIISRYDLSVEIEREKAINDFLEFWESICNPVDRLDLQRFIVSHLDISENIFKEISKSFETKKKEERRERAIITCETEIVNLIRTGKVWDAWSAITTMPLNVEREFYSVKIVPLTTESTDLMIGEFYGLGNNRIPTGLQDLDEFLSGGLRPGRVTLIGGIPGAGKTTLAGQIADNCATKGCDVLFFSMEESGMDLLSRSIIRDSNLAKSKTLELGYDINTFRAKKGDYLDKIGARLRIEDAGINFSVSNIEVAVKDITDTAGKAPVVIIDSLQRIPPSKDEDKGDIKRIVSNNIWRLKLIARDYKCPVIVISTLNREAYNKGQKANLSIFKESGDIEYSVDTAIALLFVDDEGNLLADNMLSKELQRSDSIVSCAILKNRVGKLGIVKFVFDKERCMFKPLVKGHNYSNESIARV